MVPHIPRDWAQMDCPLLSAEEAARMLALPEAPGSAHGPGSVNSRRLGKPQQACI